MNGQEKNKNKLFSVLGDSVSTLDGYSKPDDAAFYAREMKFKTNVFAPEDTWWGQVIERLGGALLANNSVSGSTVIKPQGCTFPSYGCSDGRTAALGRGGLLPDVIMVFMGLNDWGCGAPIDCGAQAEELSAFSAAYRTMLEKLAKNYPRTEIWCFTLPVSTCKNREGFAFPYRYGGRHIDEYNAVIRVLGRECGCRIVDLYRDAAPHDTLEGFHPNAEGMKTLADAIVRIVAEQNMQMIGGKRE